LIFDEATSALDSYAEKMVQKALQNLSQQHTTLVIAHRLSTIIDSDYIVVLDKGRVIEQGNHEYLLALNERYAQLWHLQSNQKK
jgi:ATP-binding cassette subfamily B protein